MTKKSKEEAALYISKYSDEELQVITEGVSRDRINRDQKLTDLHSIIVGALIIFIFFFFIFMLYQIKDLPENNRLRYENENLKQQIEELKTQLPPEPVWILDDDSLNSDTFFLEDE